MHAEPDHGTAAAAGDGAAQQPNQVPQPPRLVLAGDTWRDGNAAGPGGGGQGHREADARLAGCRGHVDQHTIAERVGAAVSIDNVGVVKDVVTHG
jgi:hypothetical protein